MLTQPRILVVDDEVEVGTFFEYLFSAKNYSVTTAHTAREGLAAIHDKTFDLALVDLKLPDSDGLHILREIKKLQPGCQVIIMTGYSTVQSAVEAIKQGAYDYLDKPFDNINQLENLIEEALRSRGDTSSAPAMEGWAKTVANLGYLVGKNPRMLELMSLAAKIAKKNINILIQGETGTGKEMLARFLHSFSSRVNFPFFAVNCGALTETLLESELFGHEKGSFTGAGYQRRGIFELADKGTLFLDEIAEASLAIQVKLLRVLETGEFLRVGGEKICHTDVRVIAATNVDLEKAVRENRFRQDLFYRLDVFKILLPPLRERVEDIPLFACHFLERQLAGKQGTKLTFAPETLEILQNYPWPGNIRELANVIAQTAAICDENLIKPTHLPAKLTQSLSSPTLIQAASPSTPPAEAPAPPDQLAKAAQLLAQLASELVEEVEVSQGLDLPSLIRLLRGFEAQVSAGLIKKTLRETLGDRKAACKLLNINGRTLRYILNEKGKDPSSGAEETV